MAFSSASGKIDLPPTSFYFLGDTASLGKSSWFSSTSFIAGGGENNDSTKNAFEWVNERRKNLRPWSEFFNFSKFGCPSATGAAPRLKKNVDHFLTNYLCVFIVLMVKF